MKSCFYKKQKITLFDKIIAVIAIIGFTLFGIYITWYKKIMKEDSEKTNAIIVKYVKNMQRGDFIFYEFVVDGVRYRGTVKYTPGWDTPFEWGDSCEIRYYRKDPEQNEGVLYDKNIKEETRNDGHIKVIKKKK